MAAHETWLTPSEVAERLRINEETVRKWLREGRMRGSYLGRVWRVSYSDLLAFMHKRVPNARSTSATSPLGLDFHGE